MYGVCVMVVIKLLFFFIFFYYFIQLFLVDTVWIWLRYVYTSPAKKKNALIWKVYEGVDYDWWKKNWRNNKKKNSSKSSLVVVVILLLLLFVLFSIWSRILIFHPIFTVNYLRNIVTFTLTLNYTSFFIGFSLRVFFEWYIISWCVIYTI